MKILFSPLIALFFLSACGGQISLVQPIRHTENPTSDKPRREITISHQGNSECEAFTIEKVQLKNNNFRFYTQDELHNIRIVNGARISPPLTQLIHPYDYLITGFYSQNGNSLPYNFVWNGGKSVMHIPINPACQKSKNLNVIIAQ